jgi:hypothetical protein
MNGFGSMISFELGSYDNAKKFLDRVRLCSLAESLGGVETLISHPETMTHASVPIETRKRLGITPGLVRISVGIEDLEDLIADLENAFDGGQMPKLRLDKILASASNWVGFSLSRLNRRWGEGGEADEGRSRALYSSDRWSRSPTRSRRRLIREGFRDLAAGVESVEALLVLVGAPRLRDSASTSTTRRTFPRIGSTRSSRCHTATARIRNTTR